jgi:hypothetical protein
MAFVLISCDKNNSNTGSNPIDSLNIGLLAHYPFNGSADDESGNKYHLVAKGATLAPDRFGNASKAYFFSGADYMEIPKLEKADGKTGSTISLWFKPTKDSTKNDILLNFMSKRADIQCSSTFILFNNSNRYALESGYSLEIPPTCKEFQNNNVIANPSGAWQHVVFIQRPVQNPLYSFQHYHYFNGNTLENTSVSDFNPISTSFTNGGQVGAKQYLTYRSHYFHGSIDDIRIYNRALLENEIQKLYTLN